MPSKEKNGTTRRRHVHEYPLVLINLLMHGGSIALLLLLAATMWWDHARRVDVRLGALLALGGAAFCTVSTPGVAHTFTPWHIPLMALSVGHPFVFWLFSRSLLDDDFALRRWHLVAWVALASLGVYPCLFEMDSPPGSTERRIGLFRVALPAIALAVLTAVQAFAAWREDLVESRRRLRLKIVAAVAVYILLVHLILLATRPPAGLIVNTVIAGALLVLGAWLCFRTLHSPVDLLALASPASPPEAAAAPEAAEAADPPGLTLDDTDRRQLAALQELMDVEQVYREPDLTIGTLAQRLQWPEHRMRRLINQGLGHRNFNAFLNTYRVDDAKRALQDARYAAVSILTISTEAGFQSLGPFNRAFKAATGLTPTEFRRGSAEVEPVAPLGEGRALAESSIG
jgi:AraC-like DNA-binding protein